MVLRLCLAKLRLFPIFYVLVRKFARSICRYIDLESGFEILDFCLAQGVSLDTILDIGSNDGTSVEMIRRRFPHSNLICVDPIYELKIKTSGVNFLRIGLGNLEGTQEFYVPQYWDFLLTSYSSSNLNSLLRQLSHDFPRHYNRFQIRSTMATIRTLDSLNLEPDFIKIDVEGGEVDVLLGSLQTLRRAKPILLVEVNSKTQYEQVIEILRKEGYCSIAKSGKSSRGYEDMLIWNKEQNNYCFAHLDSQVLSLS